MSSKDFLIITCDSCQKKFSSPQDPTIERFAITFPDYPRVLYCAVCVDCFHFVQIPFSIQRLRAVHYAMIRDEMANAEYPKC